MKVTSVSVETERRVNDGDYGSELARVSIHADLDDDDHPATVLTTMLEGAKAQVVAQLQKSESLRVRRGINERPRLCNYCREPLPDESNGYDHKECDDKRQAERLAAREQARLEREAVANGPAMLPADPPDDVEERLPWEDKEP